MRAMIHVYMPPQKVQTCEPVTVRLKYRHAYVYIVSLYILTQGFVVCRGFMDRIFACTWQKDLPHGHRHRRYFPLARFGTRFLNFPIRQ